MPVVMVISEIPPSLTLIHAYSSKTRPDSHMPPLGHLLEPHMTFHITNTPWPWGVPFKVISMSFVLASITSAGVFIPPISPSAVLQLIVYYVNVHTLVTFIYACFIAKWKTKTVHIQSCQRFARGVKQLVTKSFTILSKHAEKGRQIIYNYLFN